MELYAMQKVAYGTFATARDIY